jgi:hypothetical protein
MDPYLEARWRDVHASLVIYCRNELQPQVVPALRARVEERVVLDDPSRDDPHPVFYPDVRLVRRKIEPLTDPPPRSDTVVAEPLVVEAIREQATEGWVQIIDPRDGGRVVTVVEFISPVTKRRGLNRDAYRAKQTHYEEAGVSLVEVDLLRAGSRVFKARADDTPDLSRFAYAACVYRAWSKAERYEIYGFALRERLPGIRIPLRSGDRDAVLDLQKLIDQTYNDSAYNDTDYQREPIPPLEEPDADWADQMLRGAGVRK